MANSSSDLSSFMPEHELVELLWENGQIVMQGRSNRAKKGTLGTDSSFSGRIEEKGYGDDVNMGKFGQTGTLDPSTEHDLSHSVPCVMNSHEDDTNQWMNYPLDDDPLQNVYCPEFFSEITGAMASLSNTNNNLNPTDKNTSFGQSIKDSHGFVSPPEASKSRFNHLFGMPQQCQILPESVKSKVVDLDNCNDHNSKRFQKQDAGFQKPSHKNSNGLVNFSHFSRPAALVKANNLHNIDRSVEKSCTSARTFAVESTLLDSGSNGKPKVDDVARVHNKERSEAERVPETIAASSSVCSGYSAGAASNDRKHKSKKRFREGEESGEQSDDLEDESFALKELSSGRGSNGKRSRAAEVHNLSERRRRDRINEKMKALQELIPNCNKVDKASMLDEAIEYLKTLQLQVQMMSMGSGFCMTPMRLPPGMNLQHLRSPQMSHFSPLGMGMGIGMGMGLGFGMGMIDLNGSPGLIPVSPMPATQFPCPSPLSGLYRMPQSSNMHSLGIPAQRLPLSTPHNPFLNSQTAFPSQSTLMNPWQVSDTTPSTSHNLNMELKREASQAVCHKDSQDMHGARIMTLKPIIDSSNTKETSTV